MTSTEQPATFRWNFLKVINVPFESLTCVSSKLISSGASPIASTKRRHDDNTSIIEPKKKFKVEDENNSVQGRRNPVPASAQAGQLLWENYTPPPKF